MKDTSTTPEIHGNTTRLDTDMSTTTHHNDTSIDDAGTFELIPRAHHDAGIGHPYTVNPNFFSSNVDTETRADVTEFVSWCSVQGIDTRSFVTDVAEFGDTDDERARTNGGILPLQFDDVLSDWINSTDDAPGTDWHDRYNRVAEFNSSFEFPDTVPTRVVFRSFLPRAGWLNSSGVIALMPDVSATSRGDECMSYMHHGQHGSASRSLVTTLFMVGTMTRARGIDELQSLGYRVHDDYRTPGVAVPPSANDPALLHADNTHTIRRNSDALVHVQSSTPYNNRAYSLRGRAISVPRGTVVISHDADGDRCASIELQYPGNRVAGTGGTGQTFTVGDMPRHYVAELLHELRRTTGTTDAVVFVSWSYQTVIGWHRVDADGTPVNGTTVVPSVRYSQTTNGHQSAITGTQFAGAESARLGKGATPYTTSWQTRRAHER